MIIPAIRKILLPKSYSDMLQTQNKHEQPAQAHSQKTKTMESKNYYRLNRLKN